jgi:MFS family permease
VAISGPRASVTGVFFLNGALFSGWYARIPAIQERLDLSPGELGIALLGAPVGLLVAQPVVGAVAARRGSRPLVAAAPLYIAAIVLPALAVDAPTLLLAVLVVGAANGSLDIAMNSQGVAVERALGKRMFSSLHAAFSIGVMIGALVAAAVAAAGVAPLPHLATSAVVGAVLAALLAPGLLRDEGDPGAARFARPSGRLAVLGAIAFCALLAEGAIFDWSGVYLATETAAAEGLAPLGLAAFSLTMALGRLLGDPVAERFGSTPTVSLGALLAALGLGLAVALPTPATAIAGFALMGLGLSAVFPLTLRSAGVHGEAPGPALAAVSTFGYMGFLAGPPVIGLVAEATSLRGSFALVCALCLAAAALGRRQR